MFTWLKNKSKTIVQNIKQNKARLCKKIKMNSSYLFNKQVQKDIKVLKEIKKELDLFRVNDKDITSIQSILSNGFISAYMKLEQEDTRIIHTYTKSSSIALKLACGKPLTYNALRKNDGVTFNEPEDRYYGYWISNRSDVEKFFEKMLEHLTHHASQISGHVNETDDSGHVFTNTLLYQMLVSDLVNMVLFYAEHTNEN